MQRDMIYLPELDSVRKSKAEILAGQEKMYEAIVNRGCCVVISLNQLADSKAFLGPIDSKDFVVFMDAYAELFKNGSLKMSRYKPPNGDPEVRTASQYVLNSLKAAMDGNRTGDAFIFSSLTIQRENTQALGKIYDAIKYCDLDLLKNLEHVSPRECVYLRRYVKWILDLSIQTSFYTDAKKTAYMGFLDYLNAVIAGREELKSNEDMPAGFDEALDILAEVKRSHKEDTHKRSKWYEVIEKSAGKAPEAVGLAIAIVDLCYNLGVESSISGIDKDYHTEKDAFIREFAQMLSGVPVHTDRTQSESFFIGSDEFPDWEFAVRITNESSNLAHATKGVQKIVHPKGWKRICLAGQFLKFSRAWIYYFIFLGMEILSGLFGTLIENAGDKWFSVILAQPLVRTLIYSVIVVTVISILNSKTSHRFSIPDIEDIVGNIKNAALDYLRLLRGNRCKGRDR